METKIIFADGSIVNTCDQNLKVLYKLMTDKTELFISIKSEDGFTAQTFKSQIIGIEQIFQDDNR